MTYCYNHLGGFAVCASLISVDGRSHQVTVQLPPTVHLEPIGVGSASGTDRSVRPRDMPTRAARRLACAGRVQRIMRSAHWPAPAPSDRDASCAVSPRRASWRWYAEAAADMGAIVTLTRGSARGPWSQARASLRVALVHAPRVRSESGSFTLARQTWGCPKARRSKHGTHVQCHLTVPRSRARISGMLQAVSKLLPVHATVNGARIAGRSGSGLRSCAVPRSANGEISLSEPACQSAPWTGLSRAEHALRTVQPRSDKLSGRALLVYALHRASLLVYYRSDRQSWAVGQRHAHRPRPNPI